MYYETEGEVINLKKYFYYIVYSGNDQNKWNMQTFFNLLQKKKQKNNSIQQLEINKKIIFSIIKKKYFLVFHKHDAGLFIYVWK